ncbi:MAG: nucleoside 2-deoxyribosyltransferase [Proteobacteria bacterium]|nr:nucleoside 2-deoxyribosyltransferase [Pseudomonadota bacterium]MBU1687585.1 nucleoside 2-deoxyribosyltransferase [Pseudomonadota bacterium]
MTIETPPETNPSLTIYFAGAIRGGRDDALLYAEFIGYLQRYGRVLTEHVGDPRLLAEEKSMGEAAIFQRDLAWLTKADLVVAEVTTPSLGVGYEIGLAQAMGKEIICLFRLDSGRSLSAMIAGNQEVRLITYRTLTEAQAHLERIIGERASRAERPATALSERAG